MNLLRFVRIVFRSFLLAMLVSMFFSSPSWAEEKNTYSSVKEFLSAQAVIRVEGDNGEGFGNLSTTIRAMERLRERGFQGEYEFIYPARYAQDVMTLFGLSKEELEKGEKNNIHFIKLKNYLEAFKKGEVKKIPLAITGPKGESLCDFSEYTDDVDRESLFCSSQANSFNVDVFISVTNDQNAGYPPASYFYLNQVKNAYYSNEGKTVILSHLTTLDDVSHYLVTDPNGIDLSLRKPAIKTFIDGVRNKAFYVMPVYGSTLHIYWDHTQSYYLRNILQVIMGARYAQLYGPPQLRSKGLVIPVFYNYEAESKKITELLHNDNWGDVDFPHSDMAKYGIKQLGLADVFSTAALSDPGLDQVLLKLQPGHILLLSMGSLPKLVFDGLYTEVGQDHWPQVREGLDTLNQLMLTGMPHFHCMDYRAGTFDEMPFSNHYPNLKQELKYLNDNFCTYFGPETMSVPDLAFVMLGNLIIDSQNPVSEFSKYFQEVKMDALKPENDRVNHEIEIAMKILQGDMSDVTLPK